MKFNYRLLSPVFLSVILLTGIMVLGFPTQDIFAADEKQNVGDKDKKPLKQTTQSKIESLKGLKANEKRVIVFYKNDVKSEDLTELTKKGASVKSDFEKMRAVVVHIDAAKLKDLQLDPNIERIVEDHIVHATLNTSIPQIGANSVYSSGITGQGVKTCIVDTGVDDTHPALNPLISQHDFVNGDNDATDDHGHGTHVAGIIASRDSIYKGVAPDSSLMAAKVLDSTGSGTASGVASGINWCVANGADVINLSLGGGLFTGTCDSNLDAMAVNNAVAAGVIVAVASGNNGAINAVSSPACASGAIAVGAIDNLDGRTDFSNEGPQLDVVAPGAPVTSLKAPINGGGFATFYGTSMATPHVAGLAALILDANPSLTQIQVRSAIQNNALDLGVAGFDTIYGNGRIQASNYVNSVLPLSDSISSATGTGTISLSTISGGISSLNSISESTLPTSGKPALSFPHGFTSWTVAGLTSGQTITVTLTYPSAIPAGSQYWKVIGGSWVDATSILGSNDGDNTLTLTIQDNGPFDVNPASGIISDPGGPGVNPPTISISDVTVTEGNSGGLTESAFTVSISSPSTSFVTVDYATSDGTATAASDYLVQTTGMIAIPPGETTVGGVLFSVSGDTTFEADETFNVALSNPVGATILDGDAVVTILNDDGIIIPPRAFLSINLGGSGTILSVFGSGFTSGSDVTVQFDGTTLSITPATNGKFTTPITIPTSISGTHIISASDGVNTFTNQFIVIAPRVTPTGTVLFLNPINSASPDSVVLLHGKGFAGNAEATITISVDGVPITTTPVGKVGSFKNISITMPSTPGTHTISASDGINTAFSTFYIIP